MARNRILGYQAQARSRIAAYIITFSLLLILIGSMQVAFFGRLRPFGAIPDLMICTVLAVAFFDGRYTGAIVGLCGGFLIEAMGGQGITLLCPVYMIGGYVVGHYSRTVHPKKYTVYLFYLACACLLRAALTVIYACLCYETVNLPDILLHTVLPELGGTAIAGLVLFFPIGGICRLLERKK